MEIKLPDNSTIDVPEGSTALDAAAAIGQRLARAAVAAAVNGEPADLSRPLQAGDSISIITGDSPQGLEVLRHSAAHVLADAVMRLYPGTKLGIGPAIADGFYYDFQLPAPISDAELPRIEEEMRKLAGAAAPFTRRELSRGEAAAQFAGQPFKLELLAELPAEEAASTYTNGEFTDLCRGPHIPDTGRLKAFRLLSVAGAYWRGDEKNPMLTRIYGTAFATQKQLDEHLEKLKEAERRDHRLLGKQLDLFHIDEEVGAGLPLWHPKGALVRKVIEDFWRDAHLANGYEMVMIPHIASVELWKTSGHWDFYRENMYSPMDIEGQEYIVKPMNCPGHIRIYKNRTRSYRELPIRWAELGTVYRYERSGVLHGLLRVRGFTQDDAHLFCREDQLEDEIIGVIKFVLFMLRTFGFDEYEVYLSTRPEKSVGSDEHWERATEALKVALERAGLGYEIDPGEGVFYGPKIDMKIRDALGRAWQCTTIQVDFNLPERFDVTYVGEDNQEHRPIMIHRALLGSLERFIGCLIEHYAGAFPLWLAPVQAVILPIADRHMDYAEQVAARLTQEGIRVELDYSKESVGKKIRNAELDKVPYMLVVGDKEEDAGTVSVRSYAEGDLGPRPVDELAADLVRQVEDKS
ncbi:MAG: threonine--tRNA ligase [Actinomycetota bacterium]|nr:threonine--tRNA ligase [Actinomycetota bacterium]MCL6093783.1 threonine--tRNA ligase [Actinomycetota bacterium]MDA8166619.1 threonine--tRNA ligase [Actinomycetota bacterium]